MKHEREYYVKQVKPIGKFFWYTGTVRPFIDGDGVNSVWNWWHPFSWIAWLIFLPVCGIVGEKINEVISFKLSDYWQERKDKIEWL